MSFPLKSAIVAKSGEVHSKEFADAGIEVEAVVVGAGIIRVGAQIEDGIGPAVAENQIVEEMDVGRGAHQAALADERVLVDQDARGRVD